MGIIPSPGEIWVGSHQENIPTKFPPATWIPPGFQRFRPEKVGHSKVLPIIYNLFLQYIYILPIYLPTYRKGRDVSHLDPLCGAIVFI